MISLRYILAHQQEYTTKSIHKCRLHGDIIFECEQFETFITVVTALQISSECMVTIFEDILWTSPSGRSDLFIRNNFIEGTDFLEHTTELSLIKNPTFTFFGKPAVMHRSLGFFSDESKGYKYSGQITPVQPLTPKLRQLLTNVNSRLGVCFNAILVTVYADQNDYISRHSDDETSLAGDTVAAISFGGSRIFRIRNKSTQQICYDLKTEHGQLIVMRGDFQKEFTHEIVKGKDGVRVSYTFRRHIS